MDLLYGLLTIAAVLAVGFALWFVTDVLLRLPDTYGSVGGFMEPLALYLRVRLGLPVGGEDEDDSLAPPSEHAHPADGQGV